MAGGRLCRRGLMRPAALLLLALLGCAAAAQFQLPQLPYDFEDLEPAIDKRTMELHQGSHHKTYVDNLNAVVDTETSLSGFTLPEIMLAVGRGKIPESVATKVRNNGGGHFNHALFWKVLDKPGSDNTSTTSISGTLGAAINATFGKFDEMKKNLTQAALERFGSGWAWLVVKVPAGRLGLPAGAPAPESESESSSRGTIEDMSPEPGTPEAEGAASAAGGGRRLLAAGDPQQVKPMVVARRRRVRQAQPGGNETATPAPEEEKVPRLEPAQLAVVSTPNQDNTLMGLEVETPDLPENNAVWVPIFGLDVWEHAYYLKYAPKRKDYVEAVLGSAVNWKQVSANYEAALKGDLDAIAEKY